MKINLSAISDNVKLAILIGALMAILFIVELVNFFGQVNSAHGETISVENTVLDETTGDSLEDSKYEQYTKVLGTASSKEDAEALIDRKYTMTTDTVTNSVTSKNLLEETDTYYGYSFSWSHATSNGYDKSYNVNAIIYKDDCIDLSNGVMLTKDAESIKQILDSMAVIHASQDSTYKLDSSSIKDGSESINYILNYSYDIEALNTSVTQKGYMTLYIDTSTGKITSNYNAADDFFDFSIDNDVTEQN